MRVRCLAFPAQKKNFGCHIIRGYSEMQTVVTAWLTAQGIQTFVPRCNKCFINVGGGREWVGKQWDVSTITSEPFILELT
jgi:hypothetical protein